MKNIHKGSELKDDVEVFYAYHVEMSSDGKSSTYRRMEISEAETLVDSGEAVLYDSLDDLEIAVKYQSDRRNEYPDVIDQLDQIYHDGIDAWKETIKAVKDAHPKPE